MCGIVGILSFSGASRARIADLIPEMTATLHRRGPDAQGTWREDGVALGHRRLAIVELSDAGAQPMQSACGRYVIVFNGEIYNQNDIRQELEREGEAPAWRGHSDTETLLVAVGRWGLKGALVRASGMFALALWDRQERRLQLARDRAGEKPLYWGWCGSDFVFGSELKAFRKHPDCPRDVCRDALALYLRFAYVPAPRSIHPGLFKLEPSCILTVEKDPPVSPPRRPLRPGDAYGNLSIERYWSLDQTMSQGLGAMFTNEQDAGLEVERTLRNAVGGQMIADVPVGAFLSGGVDSSLIVALMQAQSTRPVKTFTIGLEDARFDEAPFAAAVARHLGTEHTEMMVTDREALAVIPDLPELYDEPFADSSQIPTHLVSRVARTAVRVVLSGDGGDELFGGYNRYLSVPRLWARLDWMPFVLRRTLGAGISAIPVPAWDVLGSMFPGGAPGGATGDKAHKLARRLRDVDHADDLYRSLVSEWQASTIVPGLEREPASTLDDPMSEVLRQDFVRAMMHQDMRSYLPDDILCKVDRAAMGASLESRVPFLDRDVIATAARVPQDMKIRNGHGKSILRKILYDYVPAQLIERPKAGFGIPVGDWLRGPLRDWAGSLLTPENVSRDGLLDPQPILKAWSEHLSRRRDWSTKLWIVLMFLAWREGLERARESRATTDFMPDAAVA